ncbi:hypothetical protein [Paracoccus liaowanqingii]|uniref:hypothetical protein n=1 Tax=Paracoccus liaowanqingii TaxID=2560053 RepID=UPI00159BE713|nr:hypothetical protein [Paracoccus liaowanqingii]
MALSAGLNPSRSRRVGPPHTARPTQQEKPMFRIFKYFAIFKMIRRFMRRR